MSDFSFADFLLLFVTLAITFAILYLVDRGRRKEKADKDSLQHTSTDQ